MCGEHDPFATTLCASLGSSPRVRGTLEGEWDGGGRSGIIPACAGNTGRPKVSKRNRRDHPRVCGEHNATVRVIPTGRGSSPRVRGTHKTAIDAGWMDGIIPACAGNTRLFQDRRPLLWDHPRVCGEHFDGVEAGGYVRGSSPRVRGTLRWRRGGWIRPGIIPACAGNTTWISSLRSMARDHPRVCGEHKSVCTPPTSCSGSSPRVRGTLEAGTYVFEADGIIPACAGNTRCSRPSRRCCRDHPRVCGEHSANAYMEQATSGSSPRVRGTRTARRPI